MARKGTAKLQEFQTIENTVQEAWAGDKVFEQDAPANKQEKYFVTFPYPYMNGRLHLGHTFSLSKCEFAMGYQRLKGKKTLWPFGLHCTGTPILASADKLVREMETYGYPPVFPTEMANAPAAATVAEKTEAELTKDKAKGKKSKAVAKTGGQKFQWEIMRSLGMENEEIKKFATSSHWLSYFPKHCIDDLKCLGVKVDWRRSFITTDINPFYDSFVRWQFMQLKKLGKVKFGKRYTIFSPRDNQPCMDHERSTGEGVGPQEYTLIKLRVLDGVPTALASHQLPVCLVAGTLRPETMYGQTNCWMHPDHDYVAVKSERDASIYVCSERSARNMAYQDMLDEKRFGQMDILGTFKGSEFIGCKVHAPYSLRYPEGVYVLPMLSIKAGKGTGVVTSVPSDSPDDFTALRDLKNKKPLREKYSLRDEMVLPFDPVEIINTPALGTMAAQKVVEEMKIASQNDSDKLQRAKEVVYKAGFYEGVLIVGPYSGSQVQECKKKLQNDLIRDGLAVVYYEPENQVISRSGDEAVVALCDQWFLDYGNDQWKEATREALKQVKVVDEAKRNFDATLAWIHEHACSRTYGLGTRLPWDTNWLIESLSDSTIYMAYYTVAHILQSTLDGQTAGPHGIRVEQMTPEVWDYVFLGKGDPKKLGLPRPVLDKMRTEFSYWYGVDLRASGKDLIPNHLTYYLYNHVAMWPEEPGRWPREIRANGHLLLNSEKMSKSTGNFLTLHEAVAKYSADGLRLALADAGDSLEDANLEESMCEAGLLRLYTLLEWMREQASSDVAAFRAPNAPQEHADLVFENELNRTVELADRWYQEHQFKEVVKTVFYELQTARDRYREVCQGPMQRGLVQRYMLVQTILLSPICSHICQYIWQSVLGQSQPKYVCDAVWPKLTKPVNQALFQQGKYIDDVAHAFRLNLKSLSQGKGAGKAQAADTMKIAPREAIIWIAKVYPPWQTTIIDLMRGSLAQNAGSLPPNDKLAELFRPHMKSLGKFAKSAMSFAQLMREKFTLEGADALSGKVRLDEQKILADNLGYLCSTLGLQSIELKYTQESSDEALKESVCPMEPKIAFKPPPVFACLEIRNVEVGSGLCSVSQFPLFHGESVEDLAGRLLKQCRLSMPVAKSVKKLTILRYKEELAGPRKLPPVAADALEELSQADKISVDEKSKNIQLVSAKSGKPVQLGEALIYRVSA